MSWATAVLRHLTEADTNPELWQRGREQGEGERRCNAGWESLARKDWAGAAQRYAEALEFAVAVASVAASSSSDGTGSDD